jgi:membrane protein YdbS with pleckstrin-like domain
MRRVEVLVVSGLVALVAGAGASAGGAAVGGGVAAGVVLCGVWALVFVRRRFRAWRYKERDEDLIVARGVAFRRMSVVPYGRMQFVDVTAGPIERIFGLATLKLHTAAAATDARIPGLEHAEADRLRDRLSELGEAKAQGL